jgi:hypothetical protein
MPSKLRGHGCPRHEASALDHPRGAAISDRGVPRASLLPTILVARPSLDAEYREHPCSRIKNETNQHYLPIMKTTPTDVTLDRELKLPTVLRQKGYRFYFYSNELNEPPHIHVEKDGMAAKFWLKPVRLAKNHGFPRHRLTDVRELILENRQDMLEAWYDFFD